MASKEILPGRSVYIKLEIDFTSNWNSTSPSYTDVTADGRFADGVSWARGNDQAWDQLAPGSFGFTLNDRPGTYEPATNSNICGTSLCRITLYYATSTSTAYVQFVGVIDQFDYIYPASGKDQVVQVAGVDWLTSMWLSKVVTFSALGTTAAAQYAAVCNAASIPTAYQSFTAGTYTLKPAAFQNTDCLSALKALANSQRQFLYVSKTGVITSIDLTSASVSQTYDDTSSTYPFSDMKSGVGGTGSYTIVQLNQDVGIQVQGGANNSPATANIAGSPLPKTRSGSQVLTINAAPVTNPSALVAAWASAVPSPKTYWIRELEIKPLRAPATLIPAVLAAELGDRITVVRHPLQGGSISKSASIRSIKHDIKGGDWTVTYGLSNR